MQEMPKPCNTTCSADPRRIEESKNGNAPKIPRPSPHGIRARLAGSSSESSNQLRDSTVGKMEIESSETVNHPIQIATPVLDAMFIEPNNQDQEMVDTSSYRTMNTFGSGTTMGSMIGKAIDLLAPRALPLVAGQSSQSRESEVGVESSSFPCPNCDGNGKEGHIGLKKLLPRSYKECRVCSIPESEFALTPLPEKGRVKFNDLCTECHGRKETRKFWKLHHWKKCSVCFGKGRRQSRHSN